jgi:hypothetical protein
VKHPELPCVVRHPSVPQPGQPFGPALRCDPVSPAQPTDPRLPSPLPAANKRVLHVIPLLASLPSPSSSPAEPARCLGLGPTPRPPLASYISLATASACLFRLHRKHWCSLELQTLALAPPLSISRCAASPSTCSSSRDPCGGDEDTVPHVAVLGPCFVRGSSPELPHLVAPPRRIAHRGCRASVNPDGPHEFTASRSSPQSQPCRKLSPYIEDRASSPELSVRRRSPACPPSPMRRSSHSKRC